MRKRYILVLVALLIIPFKVWALSATPTIDCPKNYKEDETVTCTLSIKATSGSISGIKGKIEYVNADLKSFDIDSAWQGGKDGDSFVIYTSSAKTGEVKIGEVKLKPNSKQSELSLIIDSYSDEDDALVDGSNTNSIMKVKVDEVKEVDTSEKSSAHNPNTGVIGVGIIALLLVLSASAYYVLKKKTNLFRKI